MTEGQTPWASCGAPVRRELLRIGGLCGLCDSRKNGVALDWDAIIARVEKNVGGK